MALITITHHCSITYHYSNRPLFNNQDWRCLINRPRLFNDYNRKCMYNHLTTAVHVYLLSIRISLVAEWFSPSAKSRGSLDALNSREHAAYFHLYFRMNALIAV